MAEELHWGERPFALLSTPKWKADKPDQVENFACQMTLVHNMFIRGVNSIYNQAPWIKPGDVKAFANYIDVWCEFLGAHHDGEESHIFPYIDEACGVEGLMDDNRDQHRAFHDGLEELQGYAKKCIQGSETYSGEKVVTIIDSFMGQLHQHLADEIPTLIGLAPYLDKLQGLGKLGEKEAQENMGKISMARLPFLMVIIDREWEGGKWATFPEMPWVAQFILRNIAIHVHSDWWKFGPVDTSGKKRAQYAGPPSSA